MYKFHKSHRLLSRKDFLRVAKRGKRAYGELLVVETLSTNGTNPKLGITISKKFGKATKRNWMKRIIRETFRHLSPHLIPGTHVVVKHRTTFHSISHSPISQELTTLLAPCIKN